MKEEYIPSHLREGYDESKVEVIPADDTTASTPIMGARTRDGINTGLSPKTWTKTGTELSNLRKFKRKEKKRRKQMQRKIRMMEEAQEAEIAIAMDARDKQ